MAKAKRGRPKGRRNAKDVPVQVVEVSRCFACGSSDREPYHNIHFMDYDGKRTTWRRTRCRACGQVRDDKTVEEIPTWTASS